MALMAFARKLLSYRNHLLHASQKSVVCFNDRQTVCRLIPSIPTASVLRRSFCILPTQVHKPHEPKFVRPPCVLSSERHISSFHAGHPFLALSLIKLSTMLTMINDCQSTKVIGIIYQNLDMLKKVEAYLKAVRNVTKDKLLVDKVQKLPPDVARKLFTALKGNELTRVAEFLGLDKKFGVDNEFRNAADISVSSGRSGVGYNITNINSNNISIGFISISSITIVVK